MITFEKYEELIANTNPIRQVGKVLEIIGLIIEADGPQASIGDLCHIYNDINAQPVFAEVVGFREKRILLMPLGSMDGLKPGATVVSTGESMKIKVGSQLVGRVLDGLGNPIDNLGELNVQELYSTQGKLINPMARELIRQPLSLGIKAIDGFCTLGKGQRMGVFAGSGVGKSVTLSMIAKNTSADLNVLALIGERGREVREFIDATLGPEGMQRSVVVVATSEQPSLVKIKAAFVAMSIAEYFRDNGKDVLFMLDSVTRIAMAQREVGLAVGEPPATRGYTPSVFALMPKFLERAGSNEKGSITGLYTVLVEGDDFNEPISDTARSILDGHVTLSRELAHRNHYPAIDVLQSISRVMNDVVSKEQKEAAATVRTLLATYKKNEDIINIGAYVKGSDKNIDSSINFIDEVNEFLKQRIDEKSSLEETIAKLIEIANKIKS